jgi:hypothetical protein
VGLWDATREPYEGWKSEVLRTLELARERDRLVAAGRQPGGCRSAATRRRSPATSAAWSTG